MSLARFIRVQICDRETLVVLSKKKIQHSGMIKNPSTPRVILALAPKAVSDALGVSRRVVAEAIEASALPVHVIGLKHRILTSDIEAWVRSWPAPTQKRRKRKIPNGE
jgi:hypothetical protein